MMRHAASHPHGSGATVVLFPVARCRTSRTGSQAAPPRSPAAAIILASLIAGLTGAAVLKGGPTLDRLSSRLASATHQAELAMLVHRPH